jgi:decaprenylphospho-beta-D-erythro-pentofuranosid-2-ulose 2-reductase
MTADRRMIWVLGATSAIAHAYARRRAERGARLLLLGRNEPHLCGNAADPIARGATAASTRTCDLARPIDYDAVVSDLITSNGTPDEVLIAYGTLEQPGRALHDTNYARQLIETNFTSAACWLLAIIAHRDQTRPLSLVVIGSVAGDRGRARNLVYGAAKSGLDRFVEGLQQTYAGTTLRLVRVKPGFVDTPMTADFAKSGLWATPDRIAVDIERAVDRGRAVVYTPWFWWPIMLIIRHLPRFMFHRLKI